MGMSNIFHISEIIEIIAVTYNKLDIKKQKAVVSNIKFTKCFMSMKKVQANNAS